MCDLPQTPAQTLVESWWKLAECKTLAMLFEDFTYWELQTEPVTESWRRGKGHLLGTPTWTGAMVINNTCPWCHKDTAHELH
jgi:hypothetical protein